MRVCVCVCAWIGGYRKVLRGESTESHKYTEQSFTEQLVFELSVLSINNHKHPPCVRPWVRQITGPGSWSLC